MKHDSQGPVSRNDYHFGRRGPFNYQLDKGQPDPCTTC